MDISLFYHGFEAKALDRPFGRAISWGHGTARYLYRTARRRQPYTGYYTAFRNLKRSLETQGVTVRVNDFAHARRHPDRPIGISGYPGVFDQVRLPNPAVFGPGFVPPPDQIEAVVARNNLRVVTLPSEWPCEIWRPVLGDAVHPLFVGIDLAAWPDRSQDSKPIDVILYDKIRWNRDARQADLLHPVEAELRRRGLRCVTLRYGHHHLAAFRDALSKARALIFLCEHETQGLAYQEAMASGVPVLAWDEGALIDPHQSKWAPEGLVVSSVPYFDARCGERFRIADFPDRFDEFWARLPEYRPRDYVADALSLEACGKRYLSLLSRAAAQTGHTVTGDTAPERPASADQAAQ
ncbi:MAG: hypothetical protein OIF47_08700 [Marinibacterium sp.]|nr:hypothetical protein [Marinibacterium sp.]